MKTPIPYGGTVPKDAIPNSSRIEGSRLSEDQTRSLYETQTIEGAVPADDIIETSNHFRAFDWVLDHTGEPFTASTIKHLHRLLKAGTRESLNPSFRVGDWKVLQNVVGGNPTTPPGEVDRVMSELLSRVPVHMNFEQVTSFHHAFEAIHPFTDGNGRVGRLILFGQCLANDLMPFVVIDDEKAFYYRGLREYPELPGFLEGTFRHFQDEYAERFRDFVIPIRST